MWVCKLDTCQCQYWQNMNPNPYMDSNWIFNVCVHASFTKMSFRNNLFFQLCAGWGEEEGGHESKNGYQMGIYICMYTLYIHIHTLHILGVVHVHVGLKGTFMKIIAYFCVFLLVKVTRNDLNLVSICDKLEWGLYVKPFSPTKGKDRKKNSREKNSVLLHMAHWASMYWCALESM